MFTFFHPRAFRVTSYFVSLVSYICQVEFDLWRVPKPRLDKRELLEFPISSGTGEALSCFFIIIFFHIRPS